MLVSVHALCLQERDGAGTTIGYFCPLQAKRLRVSTRFHDHGQNKYQTGIGRLGLLGRHTTAAAGWLRRLNHLNGWSLFRITTSPAPERLDAELRAPTVSSHHC